MTQIELLTMLSYDPIIGKFTWLINKGNKKIGDIAGSINGKGYLCIQLNGRKYLASRLAFLYMTGSFPNNLVDHIDHDPSNTIWTNLREATFTENNQNKSKNKNNTTGIKGVSWDSNSNRWKAQIYYNNKKKHLGLFSSKEEAKEVVELIRAMLHNDFTCNG